MGFGEFCCWGAVTIGCNPPDVGAAFAVMSRAAKVQMINGRIFTLVKSAPQWRLSSWYKIQRKMTSTCDEGMPAWYTDLSMSSPGNRLYNGPWISLCQRTHFTYVYAGPFCATPMRTAIELEMCNCAINQIFFLVMPPIPLLHEAKSTKVREDT